MNQPIILNFANPGKSYLPKRTCISCFLTLPEPDFTGDSEICKNCED